MSGQLDVALQRTAMRRRLPSPATRRRLRREAGLTLQIVADEFEVSHKTVARWELGERVPRGEYLPRYLALLDRLTQELASDNGERR